MGMRIGGAGLASNCSTATIWRRGGVGRALPERPSGRVRILRTVQGGSRGAMVRRMRTATLAGRKMSENGTKSRAFANNGFNLKRF